MQNNLQLDNKRIWEDIAVNDDLFKKQLSRLEEKVKNFSLKSINRCQGDDYDIFKTIINAKFPADITAVMQKDHKDADGSENFMKLFEKFKKMAEVTYGSLKDLIKEFTTESRKKLLEDSKTALNNKLKVQKILDAVIKIKDDK